MQRLEIVTLGLKSSSVVVDRHALFQAVKAGKKLTRKLNGVYRVSDCGPKYFDCEGRFVLTMADLETPQQSPALTIECAFDVHMHGKAPIQRQLADRFAQSELRLILAPYVRYFVSDMTAQMSIPPVLIPLTMAEC